VGAELFSCSVCGDHTGKQKIYIPHGVKFTIVRAPFLYPLRSGLDAKTAVLLEPFGVSHQVRDCPSLSSCLLVIAIFFFCVLSVTGVRSGRGASRRQPTGARMRSHWYLRQSLSLFSLCFHMGLELTESGLFAVQIGKALGASRMCVFFFFRPLPPLCATRLYMKLIWPPALQWMCSRSDLIWHGHSERTSS
jgi:hypothetical protein